jgi:hypothetical protein
MQLELGTLLKIPRGTPGVEPLEFELNEIMQSEDRKHDIISVNKETAPELMYVFNKAYCSVLRMLSQISFEYSQAVKYANKRKSEVILDIAPDFLKNKGLLSSRSPAGSEDLRKAVLDQDEQYLKLQDVVSMLEAAHEYLKGKTRGFEMAYHSVKKIYDVSNSNLGSLNLNHGHQDEEVFNEFSTGKARY